MYGANMKRRRNPLTWDGTCYSIHCYFYMQAEDRQWGRNKLTSLRQEPDYTCLHAIQDI